MAILIHVLGGRLAQVELLLLTVVVAACATLYHLVARNALGHVVPVLVNLVT